MCYNSSALLPSEEVHDNTTTKQKLRVVEAYGGEDVGKGIARIDYNIMRSLKASIGDIIEIVSQKKTTTARCIPLEPSHPEENKDIIRIDRLIRYNAGVSIDDIVEISKTNTISADRVIIKPLTDSAISKSTLLDEEYLSDALANIPIKPLDVVMIPYFKSGLAFTVVNIISPDSSDKNVPSKVTINTKFEIVY